LSSYHPPASRFDNIQIELNDDDGDAAIFLSMQDTQQLFHIVKVQIGRRLIENINYPSSVAFGGFPRELDPLEFTAQ